MSTNLLDILQHLGAVLTNDHFVYTSGKHGEVYINKDALYPHTRETSQVGRMMAELILANGLQPEVVVGPALGGIIWICQSLPDWCRPWSLRYQHLSTGSSITSRHQGSRKSHVALYI